MHGEAPLGVGATHVNALDWACLRALETGFALQRAVLVGDQLESAAVARRNVWLHLWIHDRAFWLEETRQRKTHS
jgi:hypothetical protein